MICTVKFFFGNKLCVIECNVMKFMLRPLLGYCTYPTSAGQYNKFCKWIKMAKNVLQAQSRQKGFPLGNLIDGQDGGPVPWATAMQRETQSNQNFSLNQKTKKLILM